MKLHRSELVIDNFAGGGGASLGIEMALGRSPDIAINHDREAVAMHEANHPLTRHYCESVWEVDPEVICAGRRPALVWLSPDCTTFSKAKGGKPVDRKSRCLAWVGVRYAQTVRPRVMIYENVEEFADWGPLLPNEKPDPKRKGQTFKLFLMQLRAAGYHVEMRELRACDYGVPTSRNRLFIIARSDGEPIVWPEPTHGPGRAKPYRTAAECIDFSLPALSIFATREEARAFARAHRVGVPKRPLAEKTMARIARGTFKYVIDAAEPFIVPVTHQGDTRVHGLGEPLRTVTGARRGEFALAAPTLVQTGYGERPGQDPRCLDLQSPLGTVVGCGVKHALAMAFLAKHYSERDGGWNGGADLSAPAPTVTTRDHSALITSHLLKMYGSCLDGQPVADPLATVTAQGNHLWEVRSFLTSYYGEGIGSSLRDPVRTVTARDRFALVFVEGVAYAIADIAMRMLSPRELYRAQGFPDSYVIDPVVDGKMLIKESQVRLVGNSVCPPLAAAIVRANVGARRHIPLERQRGQRALFEAAS